MQAQGSRVAPTVGTTLVCNRIRDKDGNPLPNYSQAPQPIEDFWAWQESQGTEIMLACHTVEPSTITDPTGATPPRRAYAVTPTQPCVFEPKMLDKKDEPRYGWENLGCIMVCTDAEGWGIINHKEVRPVPHSGGNLQLVLHLQMQVRNNDWRAAPAKPGVYLSAPLKQQKDQLMCLSGV